MKNNEMLEKLNLFLESNKLQNINVFSDNLMHELDEIKSFNRKEKYLRILLLDLNSKIIDEYFVNIQTKTN